MWARISPANSGRVIAVLFVSAALLGAVGVLLGVETTAFAGAAPVASGSPHGIVPLHKGTAVVGQFPPNPQTPLQYYGGPVLRSNETFAIFWDPSGGFSSGYRDLVIRFLQDVAADSGTTTNAYSVLNQYFDTTGPIRYSSTLAGSAIDTTPYPSGCATTSSYPVCFTDQQLTTELDRFLFANDIARPTNRVFLVFTPAGVNTCVGFGACASTMFCAYHSDFTGGNGAVVYANLPYAARPGCDTGQHPNGSPADPVLDSVSHEHKEMIDDPLSGEASSLAAPIAWFDPRSGTESSDKCVGYYGTTQNNGVGDYNQVINGHPYLLQADWSNTLAQPQGFGCVTNGVDRAPTAAFTATSHAAFARFDAGASSDPDPGDTLSYFWDFGDGTSAPGGATTNHTFPAAGDYRIVLYVTDMHAATASAQQTITVTQPNPTIPFQASLTDRIDDRGRISGSGNATRLGSVYEGSPFRARFDFSNFPASIGVSALLRLTDVSGTNELFIDYHVTLTDLAQPPQGNNYKLTGNWSIADGFGNLSDAFGSGTISGTCTSSFTSDIAICKDTWTGTIGPP